MHLVQKKHEFILKSWPALRGVPLAVDFCPPPRPEDGTFITLYVDNVVVVGADGVTVTYIRKEAAAALASAGLPMHDESESSGSLDALGVTLQGSPALARLSTSRYLKIYATLDYVLKVKRRMTSKGLEKLIDRVTFAFFCCSGGC